MKNRPHLIPALIVAIMLLVALAPLPYGYYQFLRWAVTGVAIFIAVKSYAWKQTWATWLFGAVAAMFNPILPIDLTREIWQPIDLAGALLFSLSILLLPKMDKKFLLWASKYRVALWVALVIIAIIAIRPMYWLGSIGFGWVFFWLAVAVGILATYAWVSHNTKSFVKSFLAILLLFVLVAGIIVAGVLLYQSAPNLTATTPTTAPVFERPEIDWSKIKVPK